MSTADQPSASQPLRVAIVGAGPAGIYTADALIRQDQVPVAIDLIDRLPTPLGLVRYGIAPDHPDMRALRDRLGETLHEARVRFIGNVEVGSDLPLPDLRSQADAVVYTYGASVDRPLGIRGEDLPGVLSARDLVAWYCGHPDADRAAVEAALSGARSVIVVGVGNVALDVARMLARTPAELDDTEAPQHVLDALAAAPVQRVTMLGRRGPVQASFTTLELRELAGMAGATVQVNGEDLELSPADEDRVAADRTVARNLAVLHDWVDHEPAPGKVRLQFVFYRQPAQLLGGRHVTGVQVERTIVDPDGRATGTGDLTVLPADLVIRAVGYHGQSLPGLPVDERTGTVAHNAGRVLRDGVISPGEYVAGWIKRGAQGVVGTSKRDARETVASLLQDAVEEKLRSSEQPKDLAQLLRAQGAEPVLLDGWRAIDTAEIALGATRGRPRTILHEQSALLAAAGIRTPTGQRSYPHSDPDLGNRAGYCADQRGLP